VSPRTSGPAIASGFPDHVVAPETKHRRIEAVLGAGGAYAAPGCARRIAP